MNEEHANLSCQLQNQDKDGEEDEDQDEEVFHCSQCDAPMKRRPDLCVICPNCHALCLGCSNFVCDVESICEYCSRCIECRNHCRDCGRCDFDNYLSFCYGCDRCFGCNEHCFRCEKCPLDVKTTLCTERLPGVEYNGWYCDPCFQQEKRGVVTMYLTDKLHFVTPQQTTRIGLPIEISRRIANFVTLKQPPNAE